MTKSINPRELVLSILLEVTKEEEYSHIAIRNTLEKYQYLDKQDRAFITRISEGTIENMIFLDYIIDQFSKVKVKKMKPVIQNILRSAVYQMQFMDSIPNSAACNEAVKLAKKKGFSSLQGFVNGVLRNIGRNLEQIRYPDEENSLRYLSVRYSMPVWILENWLKTYDFATVKKILEGFLTERNTLIRCNLSKITPDELKHRLEEEGIKVQGNPYLNYAMEISGYNYLKSVKAFQEGSFYVQDISSMFVAEAAEPKKGDIIIDVCAAPGGKSLHLAEKLNSTGLVEARDLSEYKVSLIQENIKKSGLQNIKAVCQDALVFEPDSEGTADIVIADLPCSGLGVIGKKTDIKYKMTAEKQAELAKLQRDILNIACRYVKENGVLIYSTCTINEQENRENAEWFLREHKEFKAESIVSCLPEEMLTDSKFQKEASQGMVQFLPGVHKSDGFFIAKFRK